MQHSNLVCLRVCLVLKTRFIVKTRHKIDRFSFQKKMCCDYDKTMQSVRNELEKNWHFEKYHTVF